MRKERNYRRRNWTWGRAFVAQTIESLELPKNEFRPLSVHDGWQQIEDTIYKTFCSMPDAIYKPERLWNYFKLDTYSTFIQNRPEQYLHQLIDPTEIVWCAMPETVRAKNKLWFYEGKIKTIQAVIGETYFNVFYIISKKYEWMICISYYDNLIATGNVMPDKLRQLSASIQTNIKQSIDIPGQQL